MVKVDFITEALRLVESRTPFIARGRLNVFVNPMSGYRFEAYRATDLSSAERLECSQNRISELLSDIFAVQCDDFDTKWDWKEATVDQMAFLNEEHPSSDSMSAISDLSHCFTNAGWLYILANSHMQGLLKIGRTDRSPRDRIDELSSATGVPAPFVLVWDEEVSDSLSAEREVHRVLEAHRVSDAREFFKMDVKSAIEVVSRVAAKFAPSLEASGPSIETDWERDDELFVAALMVVQRRGEIDPRFIRMTFEVSFEESRAVFEKLKLLGAIDASGRARPNYGGG